MRTRRECEEILDTEPCLRDDLCGMMGLLIRVLVLERVVKMNERVWSAVDFVGEDNLPLYLKEWLD